MAHYVVLEGQHNCINHATGGDDYDLSVEELRFLCQKYHDEYDAVRVILPNRQEKGFSYTTPVIQPDRPRPPSRRQRILGRIVKEIVLTSSEQPSYKSYYTTAEDNRDVVGINDNDNDNDNENDDNDNENDDSDVKELGEEDMDVEYDHDDGVNKVKDDRVESSVVASSVASNDYVAEDDNMDEDESVESKITIFIDN